MYKHARTHAYMHTYVCLCGHVSVGGGCRVGLCTCWFVVWVSGWVGGWVGACVCVYVCLYKDTQAVVLQDKHMDIWNVTHKHRQHLCKI